MKGRKFADDNDVTCTASDWLEDQDLTMDRTDGLTGYRTIGITDKRTMVRVKSSSPLAR